MAQITHPNAVAGKFIRITRTDAPFGRTDLMLAGMLFLQLILIDMVWHDDVRTIRNANVIALHAFLLEHRDLLQQYKRIHNDARPDDAAGIFVQHTRRKQMQDKLFPIDDYRVSGVVAPLETYDRICVLTEHIDDLSLSFIAPLGADDDST